VDIPAQPTAEELEKIVENLNWKREGKTPILIYEKEEGLNIEQRSFWFRMRINRAWVEKHLDTPFTWKKR
jgi:hypothetical protein